MSVNVTLIFSVERSVVGGGQRITASNGEIGIFFDESQEEKTLRRWRERAFHEEEHRHAAHYRTSVKAIWDWD